MKLGMTIKIKYQDKNGEWQNFNVGDILHLSRNQAIRLFSDFVPVVIKQSQAAVYRRIMWTKHCGCCLRLNYQSCNLKHLTVSDCTIPDLSENIVDDFEDNNGIMNDSNNYCMACVSHAIKNGSVLTSEILQVILAVFHGGSTGQDLAELLCGYKSKHPIPKNIMGYRPILSGERPRGGRNRSRDTKIAEDFEELRKELKSDEAYSKLSTESKQRYGIGLGFERVKTCVTKGRKYIQEMDETSLPM